MKAALLAPTNVAEESGTRILIVVDGPRPDATLSRIMHLIGAGRPQRMVDADPDIRHSSMVSALMELLGVPDNFEANDLEIAAAYREMLQEAAELGATTVTDHPNGTRTFA